jgi:uncharacterized membrane protein
LFPAAANSTSPHTKKRIVQAFFRPHFKQKEYISSILFLYSILFFLPTTYRYNNSNNEVEKTKHNSLILFFVMTDSKGTVRFAVPPSNDDLVLGHNHIRRTEEDIAEDRRRMVGSLPRWRRKLSYRFVSSRRMRLYCLLCMILVGMFAFMVLWLFDEARPGAAVAAASVVAGLVLFWCIELLIRCPLLTRGLLFHLGMLERITDRLGQETEAAMSGIVLDFDDQEGSGSMAYYHHPIDVQETDDLLYYDEETGEYMYRDGILDGGDGDGYSDDEQRVRGKLIYGQHAINLNSVPNRLQQMANQTLSTVAQAGQQLFGGTHDQHEAEIELSQLIEEEHLQQPQHDDDDDNNNDGEEEARDVGPVQPDLDVQEGDAYGDDDDIDTDATQTEMHTNAEDALSYDDKQD